VHSGPFGVNLCQQARLKYISIDSNIFASNLNKECINAYERNGEVIQKLELSKTPLKIIG
jgi:hypothetical protein